jgi:hypothetical protein
VTSILYEKELKIMTSNQVLNKVITHELRNGIKPKEPASSPTHSALASKQAKMLKKLAIKGSSSEEEDEDEGQTPQMMRRKKWTPGFSSMSIR